MYQRGGTGASQPLGDRLAGAAAHPHQVKGRRGEESDGPTTTTISPYQLTPVCSDMRMAGPDFPEL
jgi:hypothetical protein